MKTKKSANEKHAARSKRANNNGFSKTASKPKPASLVSDSASDPAAESDDTDSMQKEVASGASGDATPHRANVPKPTINTLQNPQEEDPLDAPTDPIIPLPTLSPEETKELRFDRRSSLDQLIECLADARKKDSFAAVIVANRDLVTEQLLYRFTSAILQVESRTFAMESREEEARNMRQLRKELIAHCWSFDFPLKVEVQRAEARLLNVLKGSNITKDVARNCGNSTRQVDCFWIVIFAAVAAWEERGRENVELVNVDMQKSLTAAAEACQQDDAVLKYMSNSLKAVQQILAASDPVVQTKVVADMSDEDVCELGSFAEQIRLLPTPAYGGLVQRMRAIMDYCLKEKYDLNPQLLEPFRFELPQEEKKSRLVQFSKSSDQVKRRD